jgi:DNA-binding SARP family transcriptional activator
MWFAVLGSSHVVAGNSDEPATISATRVRVLLAVLLWRANQPVSSDELGELVWDGTPPSGAPEAIRALVMRLRRRLDPRAAARIVTRAPGYVIEISANELDASRFEALTRQAGAAARAGQWTRASRKAAGALELWRGTPLADVPSQLLRDQWVPHLEQLRVQALDWRIEGDLRDGRHGQLIPELRDLTARYPLRENFRAQLMLALYRCGRQAEALAEYERARDVLVAELGVEPGAALRDAHQRILSSDPGNSRDPRERAGKRMRPPALTTGGDPRSEVRTVFSRSYDRLDTDAARIFRLLALHPGPDFDPRATAALAGVTPPRARQALGMLHRARLLSCTAPDRYAMHGLLRGYAGDLAAALDGRERRAALTGLFGYYLNTAAAAMDLLYPAEHDEHPRVPGPAVPAPPLADPAAARDWLDGERAILVAVSGHAAVHGWPDHAIRLARTLARYLGGEGCRTEALAVFGGALVAARLAGDRAAEAAALARFTAITRLAGIDGEGGAGRQGTVFPGGPPAATARSWPT